jgi:hypothetical protein
MSPECSLEFPTKVSFSFFFFAFIISSTGSTCPNQLILLDYTILTVWWAVEPKGSLSCLQQPTNSPYPESY